MEEMYPKQVLEIVQLVSEDSKIEEVEKTLEEWEKTSLSQDLVIIFFAGHGFRAIADKTLKTLTSFICLQDGNMSNKRQ